MLIESYAERMRRREERHTRVLRFLRDETWTSAQVLELFLECSSSSVSKTLAQLEGNGYVVQHRVIELKRTVWGITPNGLAFAWADHEPMQVRPHFEPSKLSPVMVAHHLDIQIARLNALWGGWVVWIPGVRLPAGLKKRPDAVVETSAGKRVAVEIERHVKTLKRYEAIFSEYLQAIKAGEYDSVHYICPDARLAAQLTRVFGLIKAVPVLGERVAITDKHRAKFPVFPMEHWPPDK
jgi:biotin operon repressor